MNHQNHKTNKNNNKRLATWTNLSGIPSRSSASEVRRLSIPFAISTSGGGIYTGAFGPTFIRTNCTEWASYAARYQEYRVLAIKVAIAESDNSNAGAYIIWSTDRSGGASVPSTAAAAFASAGAKVMDPNSTQKTFSSYQARATDIEDQNFSSVGINATSFQIFLYLNNGATKTYTAFVEAAVEFRGPQ